MVVMDRVALRMWTLRMWRHMRMRHRMRWLACGFVDIVACRKATRVSFSSPCGRGKAVIARSLRRAVNLHGQLAVDTLAMFGLQPKYLYLLLLVAQNTSKTLILRLAVGGKGKFLYSAAVLDALARTEGLKATSSCLWVLNTGGSPASIIFFLRTEWRVFVRVMVPAGIYNCQQMLEFVALSRLDGFLCAAFARLLGDRADEIADDRALLVARPRQAAPRRPAHRARPAHGRRHPRADARRPALAPQPRRRDDGRRVCNADYRDALWLRRRVHRARAQTRDAAGPQHGRAGDLAIYADMHGVGVDGDHRAFAVVSDFTTIIERGLWYGFDRKAVVAVVSSALGGLIVSAVLKYADSVLKGYATSASVILTGLLSAVFFGTEVDLHFMLAVINVTCSIALYGNLAGGGAHGSSAGKPIAPIQAVAVPPEEDGRSRLNCHCRRPRARPFP